MTYQEANALVDDFSFVYNGKSIPKEALIECREVIHKALEKQIPKNPIKLKDNFYDFHLVCPSCKNGISDVWYTNYCHHCGQVLNWS